MSIGISSNTSHTWPAADFKMACRSCGLSFNTSTCLNEGNLNPWQPTSYMGSLENPTPVSHAVGQQCLHLDGPPRHGTVLGDLPTMTDFRWAMSTPTPEGNSSSIGHDATEPWLRMPNSSFHGMPCHEPRHVNSTGPNEPPQPSKRTPTPSEGHERRVKKKRRGNQRSSRPGDAHHDLKCLWKDCERSSSFSTKGTLMRHIEFQHVNPLSFECPECGEYFSREDNRDAHLRSVHWKKDVRYLSPRS